MAGGVAGSDERIRTLPRLLGVQYECPTDNAGSSLRALGSAVASASAKHQLKVARREVGRRPDMGDRLDDAIGELASSA